MFFFVLRNESGLYIGVTGRINPHKAGDNFISKKQMKSKEIFITQEVANHTDLKKLKLHKAKILPFNSVNFFNTKTLIYYD